MSNSSVKKLSYNVPLWHKPNLSIEEASIYSNIGTGKLYEMTEKQDCPFVNPKSKSLFQSCVYLPEKFIVIYRTYVFTQILSIDCPYLLQKNH